MAVSTTAAPDFVLDALQCSDLAGLGCGVLDALCSKVNCTDVCDPCINPIVTVTDMPATTVAPAVDLTTVALAVDMTTVDMTTGSVLSGNDTMTASNSTMGVCEDTRIQDMTCSDVADVCSSPLLVSHCQKYCGLCV
ncbi:hypothetical protein V1264_005943 [Littorina saxatilis]|uniref:ShKT domain-containing protein n=2 Tax=Littorina saxatilis TaxID=31220 RepID=A0AAN9G3Q8_9CAEN